MVLRRVLFIGDHHHREFAQATSWLADHSLLSVSITPAEAIRTLRHPTLPPELVVVGQARPDQFAQSEIEIVHRLAPLARLAVLAGSWCEGEMRTGHPWPGLLRLYWHQGESRLRELLAEVSPLWSHPRTATEVERMLDRPAPRETGNQRLIAIGTETSLSYHGLAAACLQAGWATVWVPPRRLTFLEGAAAGIWDEAHRPDSLDPLREFTQSIHGAPVVALVNFPRMTDYQRLQDQGIRQIIAKPFMNADLISVIEQQLRISAVQQHRQTSAVA